MEEWTLEFGHRALHLQAEAMPNGERRLRVVDAQGLGYVLTEASQQGGWQSSHLHKQLRETYVVQTGWVAVAQLGTGGDLSLLRLEPGDVWTAMPGRPHNIFMSPGAITHVVKHGPAAEADWETNMETERLDALSKAVSALTLAGLKR